MLPNETPALGMRITGAPSAGTSEIQVITFGTGATAGTFRLRFGRYLTDPITWSATNNTLRDRVDAAIEALYNVGAGGVTTAVGTMTAGIGTLTVTFAGILASKVVDLMTVEENKTGATVAVTQNTPGVNATCRCASTGTIIVDTATGNLYCNTGTPNAPVWSQIAQVLG